jgi:glutathione S-transferase
MLRIWGRLNSINVQKVVWAAAELDLPFQRIDAGGKFGGLDDASYVAKNPNRRIPTIEDGNLIVWESHAGLRYIGARYGAGKIWPEDPVARAPVDMWLDWYHTEGYVHMRDVFWQLVRMAKAERDMGLVEEQRLLLEPKMALVDAQLERTPFIAGATFTIADIAVGLLVHRWYLLPIERPNHPTLAAWHKKLAERPAFKEYCDQPLT